MKIGLVLEGGAMRGMYTAGVLDVFLDNQIEVNNTFTLYDIKLEDYKLTDLYQIIKVIIPGEINYVTNTLEEELNYYLEL